MCDVSYPRRVLPQCTQLVTRRTVDQKFLLKPTQELNETLRYLLALYAKRHNVLLHAFCVLSNHMHLFKTDEQAEMPAFMRDLNAQTTRRVNSLTSRRGPLWDARKYSNVEVYGEAATWDKLVYVITNPIRHGLVGSPEEWPGLVSSLMEIRARKTLVKRPDLPCFRNSTLPKEVELELTIPPALSHLPFEVYVSQLAARVAERISELSQGVSAERRTFLGAERVLAASHEDRPKAKAGRIGQLDPRLSCLEEDRSLLEERIQELRDWRNAYYEARRRWVQDRAVVFPHGTYAMRVYHNAHVAPRLKL